MITATCQRCGATFRATRRTRRFCGDTCRQQAHRDQAAGVVAVPIQGGGPDGDSVSPSPAPATRSGHLHLAEGAVGPAEAEEMLSEAARRLAQAIAAAEDPRELAALAGKLPVVLRALRRPAVAPAAQRSPSRLDQMRQARASSDARAGYRT